jgi:hypothetical protein
MPFFVWGLPAHAHPSHHRCDLVRFGRAATLRVRCSLIPSRRSAASVLPSAALRIASPCAPSARVSRLRRSRNTYLVPRIKTSKYEVRTTRAAKGSDTRYEKNYKTIKL